MSDKRRAGISRPFLFFSGPICETKRFPIFATKRFPVYTSNSFVMPEKQFTLSPHDGSFFRKDNTFGVRFERILDHPAPLVWKALTDPAQLSRWLAPATLDKNRITLQLTGGTMGGKILQWEEDHLLEYEWYKGSVVRWELLTEGPGRCRLIFSHS